VRSGHLNQVLDGRPRADDHLYPRDGQRLDDGATNHGRPDDDNPNPAVRDLGVALRSTTPDHQLLADDTRRPPAEQLLTLFAPQTPRQQPVSDDYLAAVHNPHTTFVDVPADDDVTDRH